jgi:hypothetical protein
VADHEFHAIGNELVGNRNALLGIGDVVADRHLDLLAIDAAGGVDVSYRLLGTPLNLSAESSIRTGDRRADAQQHVGPGGTAEHQQCAKRYCGQE